MRRNEDQKALPLLREDCSDCSASGLDVTRGCMPEWEPHSKFSALIKFRDKFRIEIKRCPKALLLESANELQLIDDALVALETGVFPFSGGFLEQPAIFNQVYHIVAGLIEEAKHGQTKGTTNPMDSGGSKHF